jgi:hypothetical protein
MENTFCVQCTFSHELRGFPDNTTKLNVNTSEPLRFLTYCFKAIHCWSSSALGSSRCCRRFEGTCFLHFGVEANYLDRCPCRFGWNIFLSSVSRDQALTPTLVGSKHMSTEASYSYPEDGGSLYIRNIGSTVNFHAAQRCKSRMKAT